MMHESAGAVARRVAKKDLALFLKVARKIQRRMIERDGKVVASIQLTEAIAQAIRTADEEGYRRGLMDNRNEPN